MRKIAISLIAVAALAGCGKNSSTQASAQPGTSGAIPAAAAAAASPAPAPLTTPAPEASPVATGQISGKVLESIDAGGYTYLRIQTAAGEEWAAVSAAKVAKGDTVNVAAQMTMENFESKSLNRKFERIAFGTVGGSGTAPAAMTAPAGMPAGHPPTNAANAMAGSAMGTPAQHMSAPDAGKISVPKAEGAGAKAVAEVWGEKAALNNKPVVVRGKVVKFLAGIMGKNWVHIRDGSGTEGTNDLTVTTDDIVAIGDVVIVRGTVRADKDFGAGYKYEVIVEDAKVTK